MTFTKRQRRNDAGERAAKDRLKIAHWRLESLVPYARNARTHSDAQVAEIAGSIRAFGFTNPILVSEDGDVIAGHGRLAAARHLGLATVPVIVLSGLSEAQRRQLVLADNRIALNAGWDMEMLALELKELAELGVDLSDSMTMSWRGPLLPEAPRGSPTRMRCPSGPRTQSVGRGTSGVSLRTV